MEHLEVQATYTPFEPPDHHPPDARAPRELDLRPAAAVARFTDPGPDRRSEPAEAALGFDRQLASSAVSHDRHMFISGASLPLISSRRARSAGQAE